MAKNNKIQFTESELEDMIVECVTRIVLEGSNEINEGFWDALKGAAKKIGGDVKQAGLNAGNKMGQMAQGAMDKAKQVGSNIQQGVQNVKNYANDVKQAGINASNNADINSAIELIQSMQQRQLVNPRAAQMVINSMKKYIR